MNPKIAVVTPYYKEPEAMLRQCHESVLAQDLPADHFMIADGFPQHAIDDWNVRHVRLPTAHGDNGNTPRGVGGLLADVEGYDFIAYLDADNWFHPMHLTSLYELWRRTSQPVCCSFRTFHRLDGALLKVSEKQEDECAHVDTSCYLIHSSAFELSSVWHRMPKALSPLCDRIFIAAIRAKRWGTAFSRQRTVAFRSQYENHYRGAGEQPPAQIKTVNDVRPCYDYLRTVRGVTETVERLGFYPLPYMPIG
jgi:glycosyltransferase involved in cell wall biosynthesis